MHCPVIVSRVKYMLMFDYYFMVMEKIVQFEPLPIVLTVLIVTMWRIGSCSHNSRLPFYCPIWIEGVVVGLNFLIRLWLSQSNTMHLLPYYFFEIRIVALGSVGLYTLCSNPGPWCCVSMQPAFQPLAKLDTWKCLPNTFHMKLYTHKTSLNGVLSLDVIVSAHLY